MVIAYRYIFFEDTYKICEFCLNYLAYLVFVFPLLSVFCFISHSYGQVSNNLCSYHSSENDLSKMWYVLFGVFSLMVFLFCFFVVIKTVVDVYKLNEDLGKKLFKTLVFYAFATLVFWIPRTVFQAFPSGSVEILSNCMIFAAGILYSLIFLQEKASLKSFEQQNQTNMDVGSVADGTNMDFNLSVDEDFDRVSRGSAASTGPSVLLKGFNGTANNNNNNNSNTATQNPMVKNEGSSSAV